MIRRVLVLHSNAENRNHNLEHKDKSSKTICPKYQKVLVMIVSSVYYHSMAGIMCDHI